MADFGVGSIQQLLLPLALLGLVHRMISGDLLGRLATIDRLCGGPGLELGPMGAAFAHQWEPLLRGGAPPHRLTMGPVPRKPRPPHRTADVVASKR